MKKILFLSFSFLLLFILPLRVDASLITLGKDNQTVIWDDITDQYWFWDLNYFDNLSYLDQKDRIQALNSPSNEYFGLTDWHMATYAEMQELWNNGAYSITSSFYANYISSFYSMFRGRYDEENRIYGGHMVAVASYYPNSDAAFLNPLQTNYSETGDAPHNLIGAWAVATEFKSSMPSPVPEPSTILLLGSALIGTIFIRKRLTK